MTTPAFGVIFHPTFPPDELAAYARRAEASGFDELWLWDDCFLPGALTSAAIALAATRRLTVGIGLLPATVYNPLFAAMEITTLALAFPGRIKPGFGFGIGSWMAQIGAKPRSSLQALADTVLAVRALLGGERVSMHGEHVQLDQVQMQVTPASVPPLYVGAMRQNALRLAGQVGDGTILPAMSSPAYVRWARQHLLAGQAESGRGDQCVTVYLDVNVGPDGAAVRAATRRALAARLPWADPQLEAPGLADEVAAFVREQGSEGVAQHLPDAWLDQFAAAGTPEQVTGAIDRVCDAGADVVVFQPLNGDPACLDEYARHLMPRVRPVS